MKVEAACPIALDTAGLAMDFGIVSGPAMDETFLGPESGYEDLSTITIEY
jgi:hypothetical protein